MILVTAHLHAKSDGRDAFVAAVADLAPEVRAEDGCLDYRCYEDVEEAGHYVFVEQWRDNDALGAHGRAPHMKAFGGKVAELLTGRKVTVHEVAGSVDL